MVVLITKTDFQFTHAGDLVEYMQQDKDRSVPVRDRTGRELSKDEIGSFVEESKEYGMERQFIISPDPAAEYQPKEVGRQTRKVMSAWRSERPTANYVYAVHGHQEIPHAHVAVTGRKPDLEMTKDDLTSFRELAREKFREPHRLRHRDRTSTKHRTAERAAEKTAAREARLEAELDPDPDPTLERDFDPSSDADPAPDLDPGGGR